MSFSVGLQWGLVALGCVILALLLTYIVSSRAQPRPRNAGVPLPEDAGGSAKEGKPDPPTPLADPEDALYLEPRKVVKMEESTEYANLNPDISSSQAEGILNRLIDSVAAQTLFLSVPVQREEMYNCNKYPENLLKNWSKTLLPYDKTRVVLAPLFEMSSSDYINASHVKGFGGSLRYVAAQGPLEHTVTDFWRMAWELRVSAIIMLAKFHETSEMYPQCQLATYLRVGPPLKGNGYTITALRSRLEKNFSVTTVKIEHDGSTRTLEHYHHIGWDKDTLDVPRNLAAMLRCFLIRHNEGEVVIHCTDGLRRTSVVLLALLMIESILSEGCLRIKEALSKVRKCRPGMVSKQEDFNLALEIVDELLHGTATACVADDFNRNLSKISQSSQALFRKAHVLESISVSEAAQRYPACLDLHRFPSIIPLDTRRVVLQSEDQVADENLHDADRDKEEHDKKSLQQENEGPCEDRRRPSESYINAVWVDSHDRRFGFVVTEHPLADMRERFWRLVVQNRCANVVFCNDYSKVDQEFPNLLPVNGGEMNFGKYLVQVLAVQAPAKHVIRYQVNVTPSQSRNAPLMVTVYKITAWPFGQELPDSSTVVGDVANLLCDAPSIPDGGPTLFCCGDGVTASGLLAGAVCVVQRLRDSREVDIYRTVIKLKRCRHEFITSVTQFEFLHSVAARHIAATMVYEECG